MTDAAALPCLIVELEGQTHTENWHDATWKVLDSGALEVEGYTVEPGVPDRVREGAVYGPGRWLLRIVQGTACGWCAE